MAHPTGTECAQEKLMTQSVVMKKATPGNIEVLLEICRGSFPESLIWNGPRFMGRRWWSSVIESRFAEVWVCASEGKVAGFCVLITDVRGWELERKQRDPNLLTKVFASIVCPGLLLFYIKNIIVSITGSNGNIANTSRNRDNSGNGGAIWISLIAVLPEMRGKGFAGEMLRFCESRTLELGMSVIKLVVGINNKPAKKLYERQGYLRQLWGASGLIYQKNLSRNT